MADLGITKFQLFCGIQFLMLLQTNVIGFEYKVGNLDAWGIPTSTNKQVYTTWSNKQTFQLGDSLLFLYPPSEDSIIQVTEEAFKTCNLKNPILYMDNGNSLFNITSPGKYYFTSGVPGHCEKSQKLEISVLIGNGSTAFSPSNAPLGELPDTAPSYGNAFGSIPSTSWSSTLQVFPTTIVVVIGLVIFWTCYTT
ncbi:Early nodulin-like protein [Thalictrum thalictroides]|uniref:Early nodulin-like protein n=1 Tax=Thalictrum thalictroides TaxID=46969 RepID=A0A7J6VXD5_THATH|nr:Early nodulin-like protein [Thalictrum thalictroides]